MPDDARRAGAADVAAQPSAPVSPMADLPSGAAFGTLVHAVLEDVDLAAPDLRRELIARRAADVGSPSGSSASTATRWPTRCCRRCRRRSVRWPAAAGCADLDAARPARRARFRAAAGRRRRPGGETAASGRLGRAAAHATCPRTTRSRATPRPARYPRWPRSRCAGYLTGSIDAVLRVRGAGGAARYLVVDYKTNWLASAGAEPLTALHYRPEALAAAMLRRALSAAGAAVPRRAAPLPALAAARLRPGARTSAACSTCSCAACAGRTPRWSTACRAGCSAGARRPALVDGPVRPARRRCAVTASRPCPRSTVSTCGWPAVPPGLLGQFNAAGRAGVRPTSTWRRGCGALGGEADERVLLAAALAVRAVRHGSVCVDLAEARQPPPPSTTSPARRSPALPWPEPAAWVAAVRASPLVARGPDSDRRTGRCAWSTGLLYLDRYWRQEEHDPPRARRRGRGAAPRPTRPGCADADACDRLFADASARPAAARRGRGRAPSVTVLAGGPGTGKTTTVAQAARRAPGPAAAAACGSRWPHPPARPPPGCRRPPTPRPTSSTNGPHAARDAQGLDPAPAARLPDPVPGRGSGTTATTGCRTTSSSSTRPRWCR